MSDARKILSSPPEGKIDSAPGPDAWAALRHYTTARIALGRSGGSLPTQALLAFNLDQALARDAVHAPFDAEALAAKIRASIPALEVCVLYSAANDRTLYLQRPDLGRKLSAASAKQLSAKRNNDPAFSAAPSLAIIVSDGLSARATEHHALTVLVELLPKVKQMGIEIAPVVVLRFGRVGVMNEIGAALGTTLALILLGERPGLGAPDSLSAYFTFHPATGQTDADRNCVSNIRTDGIPPAMAATKLAAWLADSLAEKTSGVRLKEPAAKELNRLNRPTLA